MGCWACYYGPEDPERWKDRHTCGGQRAVDQTGLSRVMGAHGDHVFVVCVEVVPDDPRPLWAFHCGRCDVYGQIRASYPDAVDDGQSHVETPTAPPLDQDTIRRSVDDP